jgi:Right handed beta helix region
LDVLVENCTVTANATGIRVTGAGTTRLTLTNSTISNSTINGLEVTPLGAGLARVRVAHTTFTHNATAIKRNGGVVTSFGNNRQVDNGASDQFSSTLPEI